MNINFFCKLFLVHRLVKQILQKNNDFHMQQVRRRLQHEHMTIIINLIKQGFKQYISLHNQKEQQDALTVEEDVCAIFKVLTELFQTKYDTLMEYVDHVSNDVNKKFKLKKLFRYPSLIQYIFQFAAHDASSLNVLSFVDSIWLIYAFDPICAKSIHLNMYQLFFDNVPRWTLARFRKGVKHLMFHISKYCLQFDHMQVKCDTQIFADNFAKIAAESLEITINIEKVEQQFLFWLSQIIFSNESNYFSKVEIFNLSLGLNLENYDRTQFPHNICCILLPAAHEVTLDMKNWDIFPVSVSCCKILKIKNGIIFDIRNYEKQLSTIQKLYMNNINIEFYEHNWRSECNWTNVDVDYTDQFNTYNDNPTSNGNEDNYSDDNNDNVTVCTNKFDSDETKEIYDNRVHIMNKEAKWLFLEEIGLHFENIQEIHITDPTEQSICTLRSIIKYQQSKSKPDIKVEISFIGCEYETVPLSIISKSLNFTKIVESDNIHATSFHVMINDDDDVEELKKLSQNYCFNQKLRHLYIEHGFLDDFALSRNVLDDYKSDYDLEVELNVKDDICSSSDAKTQAELHDDGMRCLKKLITMFNFEHLTKFTMISGPAAVEWIILYLKKMNFITIQRSRSFKSTIEFALEFNIIFLWNEYAQNASAEYDDNDNTENLKIWMIFKRKIQQVSQAVASSAKNQCIFEFKAFFAVFYDDKMNSENVYNRCKDICHTLQHECNNNDITIKVEHVDIHWPKCTIELAYKSSSNR